MLVDMSCGRNTFVPSVKDLCRQEGIEVTLFTSLFFASSIFHRLSGDPTTSSRRVIWRTGYNRAGLMSIQTSSISVRGFVDAIDDGVRERGTGDRLVIGLNPPFGKNGRLAAFFIQKAVEFQPRHLVLITPPMTMTPPGYEQIYEDPYLCKEK